MMDELSQQVQILVEVNPKVTIIIDEANLALAVEKRTFESRSVLAL